MVGPSRNATRPGRRWRRKTWTTTTTTTTTRGGAAEEWGVRRPNDQRRRARPSGGRGDPPRRVGGEQHRRVRCPVSVRDGTTRREGPGGGRGGGLTTTVERLVRVHESLSQSRGGPATPRVASPRQVLLRPPAGRGHWVDVPPGERERRRGRIKQPHTQREAPHIRHDAGIRRCHRAYQ